MVCNTLSLLASMHGSEAVVEDLRHSHGPTSLRSLRSKGYCTAREVQGEFGVTFTSGGDE